MNEHSTSSSSFGSKLSISLLISFTLKNSLSNETSLFVLLSVFVLACPSINSSKDDSKGTTPEAAQAMFFERALTSKPLVSEATYVLCPDCQSNPTPNSGWLYFSHVKKAIRDADWTYRFRHM